MTVQLLNITSNKKTFLSELLQQQKRLVLLLHCGLTVPVPQEGVHINLFSPKSKLFLVFFFIFSLFVTAPTHFRIKRMFFTSVTPAGAPASLSAGLLAVVEGSIVCLETHC